MSLLLLPPFPSFLFPFRYQALSADAGLLAPRNVDELKTTLIESCMLGHTSIFNAKMVTCSDAHTLRILLYNSLHHYGVI